jgi:hypothetical protein
MRSLAPLLTTLLIAAPGAAADGPTGAYRLTADFGRGESFTVLLAFSQQNNAWAGQYLGSLDLDARLTPAVRDVRVAGDRLRFTFSLSRTQEMTFDGKLPAGRGRIPGTLGAGDLIPVALEPSALTKFDRTALLKEIASTVAPGPLFFAATVDLLAGATVAKVPPNEVKDWADRASKAAEANGVRWQTYILLRLAQALANQQGYAEITLDLVRRAERLLDPTDEDGVQLAVLDFLARLLRQVNDPNALAPVQARIDALEARDYRAYLAASPIRPETYAGRKANSNRVVLAELFTGAEDPPSLAAALAFDALGTVYKPTEVVRLQYHLHQPYPDPLATRAGDARWAYYQARLGNTAGTPMMVINGKPGAAGGGPVEVAALKLKQYRALIDPQLDTAPAAVLQLAATRSGDKVTIAAKVSNLAKPSDKVRLRLAVAESVVRYAGGNGVRYHQFVVRGFAGSPDGHPLPKAVVEQQAVVDVGLLRAGLNKELDEFQKQNAGVVFADRPLGLRSLVVVGFVQDDVTHEVLQAAQVDVK